MLMGTARIVNVMMPMACWHKISVVSPFAARKVLAWMKPPQRQETDCIQHVLSCHCLVTLPKREVPDGPEMSAGGEAG